MRQEEGTVVTVDGELAHVRVGRHEDCTGCGACGGAKNVFLDAYNGIGAKPGQHVRFSMEEEHALVGAFVVFVMPMLWAGIGGFIGWQMASGAGKSLIEGMPDEALGGAVVAFILSLAAVKAFDRYAAKSRNLKPTIVEIL